jgi:leucyl-tRNA synthetase
VAKTYPPWQNLILTKLKQLYQENNDSFPDKKIISTALGAEQSLKKYMKKVMPFVIVAKENVNKNGLKALNLTLDFDEQTVLKENLVYLHATLELEGIDVKTNDTAEDKIKEECCPGKPFIIYRVEESATVHLINPHPYNGLFTLALPVYPGDSIAKLGARLSRTSRHVKAGQKIKLMRFNDPLVGPRKIPVQETLDSMISEIDPTAELLVDVKSNTVELKQNGSKIAVGSELLYVVAS